VIDRIRVDSSTTPLLRAFSDLLAASSVVYAAARRPERMAAATEDTGDITITVPVRDEQDVLPGSAIDDVGTGDVKLPPSTVRATPTKDE
jgi:hypothetical protein